jgi:hypothetical protein
MMAFCFDEEVTLLSPWILLFQSWPASALPDEIWLA